MSSLLNLPFSLVMVIDCDFPLQNERVQPKVYNTKICNTYVPLSAAATFMMPFASISNVTSICGTPRGAGGMPESSNLPRRLLSLVSERSPSKTWMRTVGWLSAAVEKLGQQWVTRPTVVVRKCDWHLTLFRRNDGVTRNEFGKHATSSFDTERQRANVDEKNAGCALGTREDATLDSGTICNSFIGVDSLGRFLPVEEIFEELLNLGNARWTANEDDLGWAEMRKW
jgi:hypothetical protein